MHIGKIAGKKNLLEDRVFRKLSHCHEPSAIASADRTTFPVFLWDSCALSGEGIQTYRIRFQEKKNTKIKRHYEMKLLFRKFIQSPQVLTVRVSTNAFELLVVKVLTTQIAVDAASFHQPRHHGCHL